MAKKQDIVIGFVIFGSFAIFILFLVIFVISLGSNSDLDITSSGDKVGVIELNGVIASPNGIVKQFKDFSKDENIKAIVFRIDSPGGGVAASQEIYEKVRRVRDDGMPVVASMGTVAASGGYYVALGSDYIMANPGTTTGSIGVIAEIPNFSKLLEKIGVSFTIIKSGKYKDIGSPYRESTKEELSELQKWIDNGYDQFVKAIVTERELDESHVRAIGDGRVYSGEQALGLGLIDSLGTFEDAIQYAAELGGISGEPRIHRVKRKKVTIFDIVTGDVEAFILSNFGSWPRVKYQMVF